MHKNYLLFVASLTQKNASLRYCKGARHSGVFAGLQTNVAPSQYIQAILAAEGEKFEKIIILATKEVRENKIEALGGLTTIEHYKQQIIEQSKELNISYGDDIDCLFSIIPYDTEKEGEVSEILNPLVEITKSTENAPNKRLYIDFTGGIRTAAMALVFVARYFEAKKFEIADIIYANIVFGTGTSPDNPAPIEECKNIYNTFNAFANMDELKEKAPEQFQSYVKEYGTKESEEESEKITKAISLHKSGLEAGKIDTKRVSTGNKLLDDIITSSQEKATADLWTRIYRDAKNEEFLAFNYFNENVMRLLSESGKLNYAVKNKNTQEKNYGFGTAELFFSYRYYETYMKYVRKLLEHIIEVGGSPAAAAKKYALTKYRVKDYSDSVKKDEQVKMSEVLEKSFNLKCKGDIYIIQDDFASEIIELTENRDKITVENLLEKVNEYNKKLKRLQYVYCTHGFPFPCINGNSSFLYYDYESTYKNALNVKMDELETLYNNNDICRLNGKDYSYSELMEEAVVNNTVLCALFPLHYIKSRFKSEIWNEQQTQEFLINFLPMYAELRRFRNKVTHPDKIKELNITPEQLKDAYARIRQSLELIRDW